MEIREAVTGYHETGLTAELTRAKRALATADIAARPHLSESTVRDYLSSAITKTGTTTTRNDAAGPCGQS
ncbi:hypothetical protein [Dactylosporangium sp. NPDC051484]|uniref:hypothetical protein n=1 Tax=Dactylosporangium sp. NPDC051484 TaxID=3154942 RepID=UPI00344B4752